MFKRGREKFIIFTVASISLLVGHALFHERLSRVKTPYEQWLSSVEESAWSKQEGESRISIIVRLQEKDQIQKWSIVGDIYQYSPHNAQVLKFLQLIREGELVERNDVGTDALEVEVFIEDESQVIPSLIVSGRTEWRNLRNNWPAQNLILLLETGAIPVEGSAYVKRREERGSHENEG